LADRGALSRNLFLVLAAFGFVLSPLQIVLEVAYHTRLVLLLIAYGAQASIY
jgi:hypothetical protein